jgi:hypothetical protein
MEYTIRRVEERHQYMITPLVPPNSPRRHAFGVVAQTLVLTSSLDLYGLHSSGASYQPAASRTGRAPSHLSLKRRVHEALGP